MTTQARQRILYNHMRRKFQHLTGVRIPLYKAELHAQLIIGMANFCAQVKAAETARRLSAQ